MQVDAEIFAKALSKDKYEIDEVLYSSLILRDIFLMEKLKKIVNFFFKIFQKWIKDKKYTKKSYNLN